MTRYVRHLRREESLLVPSVGVAVGGSSYATEKTLQSDLRFREGRRDVLDLGNSRRGGLFVMPLLALLR